MNNTAMTAAIIVLGTLSAFVKIGLPIIGAISSSQKKAAKNHYGLNGLNHSELQRWFTEQQIRDMQQQMANMDQLQQQQFMQDMMNQQMIGMNQLQQQQFMQDMMNQQQVMQDITNQQTWMDSHSVMDGGNNLGIDFAMNDMFSPGSFGGGGFGF